MIDIGLEDTEEFNKRLLDWLIEYNSVRPHQALDYLTPLEYIDTHLLPMSSSRTKGGMVLKFMLYSNAIWPQMGGKITRNQKSSR